MLRLHPSELTLTPEDVDETFRRIALRQTSRAQQHWTMPPAGSSGQPGRPNRPILRRGPQRLIRHAMTINNMSIVQPQQAVNTSVDEDDESHQEAVQPPVGANSRPSLPHPTHPRTSATVGFPAGLPPHSMQLPLRLRSHLHAVNAQTILNEQTEGNTSHAPPPHLLRPERAGSTSDTENGNEQRAQLPSVDSSANTPGLRGGGLASVARTHNVTQDTIYAASPLNHIQRLSSRSGGGVVSPARAADVARDSIHAPSSLDQTQKLASSTHQVSSGDSTKLQSNLSIGCPTPRSKNCSTESPHSTHCPNRTRKYPPSSEPRRGSGRHAPTARSWSSGDVASSSVMGSSASILEDASNDMSVPLATTEPPSRHDRGPFNSHSKDGDASSAGHVSRYLEGLGESDQTSLRRGSGASAVYSWYGSLGSDTQFPGSENSQTDESCSQLDGAKTNTHRLSPLPSLPYTRIQDDSAASSPPPPAHSSQLLRDHVSATTAVQHDLQSPLDAHVEPHQRQQQTRHTLLNFATHANPAIWPGPDHGASHQQSSPASQTYSLRNLSRTSEISRLEQRSSENDAVSAPVYQGDATRHGRVQMQRAVYERLQNPIYTRHAGAAGGMDMLPSHDSVPRRNPPHDVSNQARNDMAHDGEGVDAGPSRPPPSQLSRQHRAESTSNTSPRVYGRGPGGARAQPWGDGPLGTLASMEPGSDPRSRYWQSPLVRGTPTTMPPRTHRRMRGEQRDQENAGEDEEEAMRREEANVTARYGEEEQQRTTMNETPPRIGRVERRMME